MTRSWRGAGPPFECRLRLKHSDFIMQNHRVHGVSLMPGVTFLDILFRILIARGADSRRALIRNIVFEEAIATTVEHDREIRITFAEPNNGVCLLKAESRWQATGQSSSASWRENFRGELSFSEDPEPPPIDLAALKRRTDKRRDMDGLYARARAEDIHHGRPMRGFGHLHIRGSALLAEIDLEDASPVEMGAFHIHPAILDASTIAAFGQTEDASRAPFIPICLNLFRSPRPLKGTAYIYVPQTEVVAASGELIHNDYGLYDGEGRLVAEFGKLTCKRIRRPQLVTRLVEEVAPPSRDPNPVSVPVKTDCAIEAGNAARSESRLARHLRHRIAAFLNKRPQQINTRLGFYDLGLDSLAMLRLSQELETVVGSSLYPTLLFEYSDIDSLAAYLETAHVQPNSEGFGEDPPSGNDTPELKALCYRPVWRPVPLPEERPGRMSEDWIVLGAEDDLVKSLGTRLTSAGARLVRVEAGIEFEGIGRDHFRLDFRDRRQLCQLLESLEKRRTRPRHFVQIAAPSAAGPPSWHRATFCCLSLWALAAALVDRKLDQECDILSLFVGRHAAPEQSAVAALLRTLSQEAPRLNCRNLQLEMDSSSTVAEILWRELASDGGRDVDVRYSGTERLAKRFSPYPLDPPAKLPFKEQGIYLIAGGGGGLGVIVADYLAKHCRARLILVGRSPLTPTLQARLEALQAQGAQVEYFQADIARQEEADKAIAQARALYGRIDGIFHCAGVLRDALFFRKEECDLQDVLAPKIAGAIHLDVASRHEKLDFFVLFSSLATCLPQAGQADYAYANAFLESFADWRSNQEDRSGKTLAISWPLWEEGGMRPPTERVAQAEDSQGIWPLPTSVGIDLLWRGLAGKENHFAVVFGEPSRIKNALPQAEPPSPTGHMSEPPRKSSSRPGDNASLEIAIIGLAGRYPQAPDLDSFWRNLRAGRDCITEIPRNRWDHGPYFDPAKGCQGKTYGKWGGFLEGIDLFDPAFFGISRRDAERMDPQERLFLKTCWQTLEDAGYRIDELKSEAIGVFVGVMWNHYQLFDEGQVGANPTAMHASIANRVSYCLDLRGPSLAVDTACSSSLTAIHLAVESIRRGECSCALAGGVNLSIHPQKYLQLAQGQFLSDDGRCRAFGKGASGYVPGEGVGAILLKPLRRAEDDGDHVYGVIRGSQLNHTGSTSGFMVPSPDSQAALIRGVLRRSRISPQTISYIEAHGTGTALGDPIEIEGLGQAFDGALSEGGCAIGSVKSNVGHLESAAGIAGLTKVLLQMEHRQLVPSLHAHDLNPLVDWDASPFFVVKKLQPWTAFEKGGPLRAGVSGFGAGGANAHLIIESHHIQPEESFSPAQRCLFVLSAREEETLKAYARSFVSWLNKPDHGGLRRRLCEEVAALLEVEAGDIDSSERLGDLGLGSEMLLELAQRIADHPIGPSLSSDLRLEASIDDLAAHVQEGEVSGRAGETVRLADLTFTLQVGRVPMPTRMAIVARDLEHLRAELERFVQGEEPGEDCFWGEQTAVASAVPTDAECVQLFRTDQLPQLAEHWAAGGAVPWRSCYPPSGVEGLPRRISVPTYPFREERCWIGHWKAGTTDTPTEEVTQAKGQVAREAPSTARPVQADATASLEFTVLDPGIALLVMRESGNMFTERLVRSLQSRFSDIARRPDIKAVVITGSADVFSRGATPEALEKLAGKTGRFTDLPFLYEGFWRCERPVIAAIQGDAAGGGLMFGLHADIVLMSRDAVYSANFIKYGFTPGMGGTYILERRFGLSLAAEMFFTGKDFAGGELERRVSEIPFLPSGEVLPAALAIARSIADKPPDAIKALKNELAGRVLKDLPEIVAREVNLHEAVLGRESVERVQHHFESVARFNRQSKERNGQQSTAGGSKPDPPLGIHQKSLIGSPTAADGRLVVGVIQEVLCSHLYLAAHEVEGDLTFSEMGLDSLGAVEMVQKLNRRFGLDLDSVAVYDHPTQKALSDLVLAAIAKARTMDALASRLAAVEEDAPPESPKEVPVHIEAPGRVTLRPLPRAPSGVSETQPPAPAPAPPTPKIEPAPSGNRLRRSGQDIAIIGMSGRFPDAEDLSEFWNNLAAGHCSIREVPPERWDISRVYDSDRHASGKTYSKWAALLSSVDRFDPAFFNLSPLEAEAMDPQQRLFLQQAWAALDDAGYASISTEPARCGVFVGTSTGDYAQLLKASGQADSGQAFLGNSSSVLPARIAYFLNLSGPTLAVDTACSSSLVAVHLASESLRGGGCDMALAGGVALMLTPQMQVWTSQSGMLSPSGKCSPFDKAADGIVLGEGVGVVVLKLLKQAQADGDFIHGVILASGINGDGKTNGITAPSAAAQASLMAQVHAQAGIGPEEIGYVEAHGTATALGDPIEVKALEKVFGEGTGPSECGLGSVKSNIGHATLAAGIAGLLKVQLAMRHRKLPPSLGFESPNPKIDFGRNPFFVVSNLTDWQPVRSKRRIAAVSSFGFSGTNCHMVVAEAPEPPDRPDSLDPCYLVPVSANSASALRRRIEQLADRLDPRQDLLDVAFTLSVGRTHHSIRTALIVRDHDDLDRQLRRLLTGTGPRALPQQRPKNAPDSDVAKRQDGLPDGLDPEGDARVFREAIEKLAAAYVEGHDPDWARFYRTRSARRIPLPTYPFEGGRHWIEAEARPSESKRRDPPLHPLLGHVCLQSSLGEGLVFEGELSPDDWIVSDHRVADRNVLPAAACLELALAAADYCRLRRPYRLSSVEWLRPFEVTEPRKFRFSLSKSGHFELVGVGEPMTVFARGSISRDADDAPEVLKTDSIAARCPRSIESEAIYRNFDQAGIHYGTSFRVLEQVSIGQDEALGKLKAPTEAGPSDRFHLHPSLLDGALQTVASLVGTTTADTLLPFSLESLRVRGPLTAPALSHVIRSRDQRFQVRVSDATGHVCVEFEGFLLLPSQGDAAQMIYLPTWQEVPTGLDGAEPNNRSSAAAIYAPGAQPLAQALLDLHGGRSFVEVVFDGDSSGLERLRPPYDTIYFLPGSQMDVSHGRDGSTLALFRLVKALVASDQIHRSLTLKVVLNGVFAVVPDEIVDPHGAGLVGLARAIATEYPQWSVGCIDVGVGDRDLSSLALRIVEEALSDPAVALREERRFIRRFAPLHLPSRTGAGPFRRSGAYLIVGGAGGIGFALSRCLARTVGACLAWIGRRTMSGEHIRQIEEIEALGGKAVYFQADVTDLSAVRAALAQFREDFGPLSGVFHAALVLHDTTLANMDEAALEEVLAPKVRGSSVLLEALQDHPPKFLVIFSSAASFLEPRGQANYAAASTAEDALALQARQTCGYPVTVVNWGYWGNVGAVAKENYRRSFESIGVGSIEPEEGLEALGRLLAADIPQALVIKAKPRTLKDLGIVLASDSGLPVPTQGSAVAFDERDILSRSRQAFAALERLSRQLLCRELADRNVLPGPGDRLSVEDVKRRLGVRPPHNRLFNALIRMMETSGILRLRDGEIFDGTAHVGSDLERQAEDLVARFPDVAPHVQLLKNCVAALPEILDGRKTGMEVFFPQGSLDIVEEIYKGQPAADFYHRLLAQEIGTHIGGLSAGNRAPIRLLEVGAGTGSATRFVLRSCDAIKAEIQYFYTDVSSEFLRHGERVFAAGFPYVVFKKLNIEEDPSSQGFDAAGYDVVFASNVLHATSKIGRTLQHLKSLLKPDGLLLINEVTRNFDFLTLTFGLTPGWWAFEDSDLRLPNGPLLSPDQWGKVIAESGLQPLQTRGIPGTPVEALEQCLLVARKERVGVQDSTPLERPTRRYLRRLFAEVLKLDAADLDERLTFEHFGVDSLVGMRIIHRLEQDFGNLPATLLFEHMTIRQLTDHLLTDRPEQVAKLLRPSIDERPASDKQSTPAATVTPPSNGSDQVGDVLGQPSRGRPSAEAVENRSASEIAIVGVSGRYPGAPDLATFWRNLANGRDCVTEIPPDRWDWKTHFDPKRGQNNRSYGKWGGFLDGIDLFDAAFFNILPREAVNIDPQERLFLETCWNLLEEAGCLGEHTREPMTGVFTGVMYGSYGKLAAAAGWPRGELSGGRSDFWSIANRISYFFDFHGPSFAVDSACSSALTAVHLACESLRRGDCRMAIAGGVNLILHPAHFVGLSSLNMLSSSAGCRVFDQGADGFVPGEGVGAVLLKPLERALADGDSILAVIKASFLNAGGKTSGYTVPNPDAQGRLIGKALRRARVHPQTITCVEAHGTGTELGDPIEIAALNRAFMEHASAQHYCSIGSVKSNIGHLEGAAGIAGLTKVLLQMRHGKLVPSLHLERVNPKIAFAASPFYPQETTTDWVRPVLNLDGKECLYPRRAGVSSFGAGGANAHIILEEFRETNESLGRGAQEPLESQIFVLSSRTRSRLRALAEKVVRFLAATADLPSLRELAYASQVGRQEMSERVAVVAHKREQLRERLQAFVEKRADPNVFASKAEATDAGAFLLGDEDGSSFVDSLIRKRRLAKLAQIWALGARIDWRLLWPDPKPRRGAFPTQHFEKKRYWLSTADSITDRQDDQWEVLKSDYTLPQDAFYLVDHKVAGDRWVPGVAFLEMARALCPGPAWTEAFRIRQVRWPAPLNLDEAPCRLKAVLKRHEQDIRFRFVESGAPRRVFAQGTLSSSKDVEGADLDLPAIRRRCSTTSGVAAFYDGLRSGGLDLGRSFRVLGEIHLGREECLARLVLPEGLQQSFESYVLHPSLLDGALQAVAAFCGPTTAYLPVGIAQVTVRRRPTPRCWVHAHEVPAPGRGAGTRCFDLIVADEEGCGLLMLEGLEIAPLPRRNAVCRYFRPTWEPALNQAEAHPLSTVLVLTDDESLLPTITRRMSATAGARCLFAVPGAAYTRRDNATYEIVPHRQEHFKRLAADLCARNLRPNGIIHFCSRQAMTVDCGRLSELVETSVLSVLWLATAALECEERPSLSMVFAYSSLSSEPQPHYAAVAGVLKTLALEHSAFSAVQVAFEGGDEGASAERLSERLCDELLHSGEGAAEIRYKEGQRQRRRLESFQPPALADDGGPHLRPGGTYLITGGAGALGLRFASFLVKKADVHIVLAGRSPLDARLQDRVDSLSLRGSTVEYQQADVARFPDVKRLLEEIHARHGPLNGVLHAAGVTRDSLAMQKTLAELQSVLAPKVLGTVLLDQATQSEPLDFFVLFSSLAGETGNIGQADYAFANAFQNEFALLREQRRQAGIRSGKTLAMVWPLWREGGMKVDPATAEVFARRWGMVPMSTESGLRAFCRGLAGPETCCIVVATSQEDASNRRESDVQTAAIPPKPIRYPAAAPLPLPRIERDLRHIASQFLLVDEEEVELEAEMMELGFDSISLTELVNKVNEKYGLDLLPTVLFESPSLSALARYLHQHCLPAQPSEMEVDPQGVHPGFVECRTQHSSSSGRVEEIPTVSSDIAIIGMAGSMPQSPDLEVFWQNLAAGRELVTRVPEDRVDLRSDPDTCQARGGFLERVDGFDAELFSISPREAALMDPQQRLFLQTVRRTIEDAGYKSSDLAGTLTGLFVGVSTSDYDDLLREHDIEVEAHTATGIAHSVLANRVSYLMDFRGTSEAIDTACSSSLVAIHRAVRALQAGECEMAIVGGANVILSPGLFTAFAKSGMLSPTGRCQAFAAAADGYVRGEGVGALLLKPVDRAMADADHIYAVIKGSAVNHGGRANSLTAPNPAAQAEVLIAAYRESGVDPDAVSYIEGHGTGTSLGDPIEIEGIKKAFAQIYADWGKPMPERPQITIGSVKTNIGHLEAAAGIAGVLKVLLAMKHGTLPGILHLKEVNPHVRLKGTPFRIHDRSCTWGCTGDENEKNAPQPRIAGVSSFGFGGTNAHLVLSDYANPQAAAHPLSPGRQLLVLSAPTPDELTAHASRIARYLERNPELNLDRVVYTLQVGREELAERFAAVVTGREKLVQTLEAFASGQALRASVHRGRVDGAGKAATPDLQAATPEKMEHLAETWVGGGVIDWHRLWMTPHPRRTSVPGLPFQEERHWFDAMPRRPSQPAVLSASPFDFSEGTSPIAQRASSREGLKRARGQRIKLSRPRRRPTDRADGSARKAVERPSDTTPLSPKSSAPSGGTTAGVNGKSGPGAEEILRDSLSSVLGIPAREIDADRPFAAMGLDSIYMLDLVRHLNSSFSLDLSAADLYDQRTLARLSRFVESARKRQRDIAIEIASENGDPKTDIQCNLEDALSRLIRRELSRSLEKGISFADNGLTSFDMLRVIAALEERLGVLRKTLLFDHPTLEGLAAYLQESHGKEALDRIGETPAGPDSPPAPSPTDRGAEILLRRHLRKRPQIQAIVTGLQKRYGKESGLAGRDIAPHLFIDKARTGYFNFSKQDNVLLAWSYVGSLEKFPQVAREWIDHARRNGFKPNFLSMIDLAEVGGEAVTSTPFGAIQRIEDLSSFNLKGRRMRRLRYMIQRFRRKGECRTIEYRCGADHGIDRRIAHLIDGWRKTKNMVNPYVSTVQEEVRLGRLDPKHRIFLTYRDKALVNVVIITPIPSENGYLLDLEFYSDDMPTGGLDHAIVHIIDRLLDEECTTFSFGASFGVKICDSPNASPAVSEAFEQMRSVGIFTGEGNFRFKNKFRPINRPVFLCRPVDASPADVSKVILMIANPTLSDRCPDLIANPSGVIHPGRRAIGANGGAVGRAISGQVQLESPPFGSAQRDRQLEAHDDNNRRPPGNQQVDYNLATDSWAELEAAFISQRMNALSARIGAEDGSWELKPPSWLPFGCVLATSAGRTAEALLCRAYSKPDQIVVQNLLFPSWTLNQVDHRLIPRVIDSAGLASSDTLFRGDVSIEKLETVLAKENERVAFLCLELSNNAGGGYPISLGNLRQVRQHATRHGIPLVLDATRILENAFFIAAFEEGQQGRDVWDVVQELLSLADSASLSLSKDFGIDFGGLVATNDPSVADFLRERLSLRGSEVHLTGRKLAALALQDRPEVARLVRQRMDCVRVLWQRLTDSDVPVVGPASGHCVLIDVAAIPSFIGSTRPIEAFLSWLWRKSGIRGAPHLAGGDAEGDLRKCVRLAVPLGLGVDEAERIADRIGAAFRESVDPNDLTPTTHSISLPWVTRAADRLSNGPEGVYPSSNLTTPDASFPDLPEANQQVLQESGIVVEVRLVRRQGREIEVFAAGVGPPLLLLHPFNIGAGFFAPQFEALSDRYRVVVIHAPGVGATGDVDDLSLDGMAQLFWSVLLELDMKGPVHVAGASFGGLIGQALALRYPEEIETLTLIGSSYKVCNRAGDIEALAVVAREDFDRLLAQVDSERLRRQRKKFESHLLRCESMDPQIGLRYLDEFATKPSLRAHLPQIKAPTLIVQGRHDTVIGLKTAHLLHGLIPDVRYEEIANAGHFPSLTSSRRFNRVLASFLAEHEVRDKQAHLLGSEPPSVPVRRQITP